jgi:hypothetical protein
MSQHVYGVKDHNGNHVDVSKTLRGAKCYATINDYHIVTVRFNCGYITKVIARKLNDKWITE